MSTILIVDDDESIREMLRELLSPLYECYTAGTVEEALAQLQVTPFDVVMTDISLPDRSGLDLLGLVRQFQPQTPVIVISGINDVEYARGLLQMGAFGYLAKPFQMAEATGAVARAIESRRFADSPGYVNNRRQALRYVLEAEVRMSSVLVFESEQSEEDDMLMVVGYTHDISENGLALIVPRGSLDEQRIVGATFHIVLGLQAGAVSIEATGIRYQHLKDNKSCLIGVQITNISGRDRVLFLQYLYMLSNQG